MHQGSILLLLFLVMGGWWSPLLANSICPQAKLLEYDLAEFVGDANAWQIDMTLRYQYDNPTYDTVSPEAGKFSPSDHKNVLMLEMMDVVDSSEGEETVLFKEAPPYSNWRVKIYPLKNDPQCTGLEEPGLFPKCRNRAFAGFPPSLDYFEIESHVSGPFLSDTNQCEWYQQGWFLLLEPGKPIEGDYLAGRQRLYYQGYLIWDWDWEYQGNKAEALWLDFWESDEGYFDDKGLVKGITYPDGVQGLQSDYASVLFFNHEDVEKDDNDGIPASLEVAKFGTNPQLADTDGDGLPDGSEIGGFLPCIGGYGGYTGTLGYGTDPLKADTDGDGLLDSEEIGTCKAKLCLNPMSKSLCNDGTGTDPGKFDPDGDGDGVDLVADNCPTVKNPDQANADGDAWGNACENDDDNDGLQDVEEEVWGTDPLKPDTDGDGVSDGDEVKQGRNPTVDEGAVVVIINLLLLDDEDEIPPPPPPPPDQDGDGIADTEDNCPQIANLNQKDFDQDGVGDACDLPALGDLDQDGDIDLADVKCELRVVLYKKQGKPMPKCLKVTDQKADLNCDGKWTSMDMSLVSRLALACTGKVDQACPPAFPKKIDNNQNDIHDGCEK